MADLVDKAKAMVGDGIASNTIADNLASDVEWISQINDKTVKGDAEVKAMLEGMREKMAGVKMEFSNWMAADANTVSWDAQMPDKPMMTVTCTFNADGKIQKWVSAAK